MGVGRSETQRRGHLRRCRRGFRMRTPCVWRMVMSSLSLFRKSSAERGRWIHHTTGVGGNLLHEGVARYYGVKQYAKLAPGGLAYPGSGPANATTGAHRVGDT